MRTATTHLRAIRARNRPVLRSALAVVLLGVVGVTGISGPAQASDISIPFDELVFGQPGSTVTIATADVSAEMVGRTCNLTVLAENQSSVHIGNDLVVSTGTSQAVIFGVEDTPNGGTSESYEMVVGATILVQLRIGEDGMSSLGFDLSFDCVQPVIEQTTTVPTIDQQQLATTTTTVDCAAVAGTTDATTATTDTTAAAGGVTEACEPACGDGTPGAGAVAGGTDTTVAGQATTETTVCTTGQVVTATTATTVPTTVTPTVAGSSTNHLPETPAARAVAGSPSYTG